MRQAYLLLGCRCYAGFVSERTSSVLLAENRISERVDMKFLTSVRLIEHAWDDEAYPFTLQVVRSLDTVAFPSAVTFLVGENGSGKSTLLEGIAAGIESISVGGEDLRNDPTLAEARQFAEHLRFSWRKRTRRGFFLRAEDFFNYTQRMAQLVRELDDLSEGYEERLSGYSLLLAQGMARGQRHALVERYGEDLRHQSHGESFLQFFQSRFVPNGLYLLDEPDTALSPQRQITLLSMLKDMVAQGSQFIIATHSPILMAFPDAVILSFDGPVIAQVAYEDVSQVLLTRNFLRDPRAFVRRL